ncbi:MAG: hypothetical protein QOD29_2948 [Alphaproteobacteria bacterium]|jgi:hypothetical protein|nr:hypothetical protein [Alphaproteobacteria bacterium]
MREIVNLNLQLHQHEPGNDRTSNCWIYARIGEWRGPSRR